MIEILFLYDHFENDHWSPTRTISTNKWKNIFFPACSARAHKSDIQYSFSLILSQKSKISSSHSSFQFQFHRLSIIIPQQSSSLIPLIIIIVSSPTPLPIPLPTHSPLNSKINWRRAYDSNLWMVFFKLAIPFYKQTRNCVCEMRLISSGLWLAAWFAFINLQLQHIDK